MQHTKAHGFLSPYRAFGEDCKKNVLSQGGIQCKSGKWFIPDEKYVEFLDTLHKDLTIVPPKKMHFLEIPSDKFNMVKVDVDLRFKATEEELNTRANFRRRYTDKFIDVLVNTIANNIKELIDIETNYNIYIQEKSEPRITHENYIKDGIHIIIPELVMSNTALFYLREQIVECDELKTMIKEIENTSDINDVIDKRIIYPNAWYVYGCGKPEDNGKFYTVTKVFKILKKNETILVKKTQSDKKLIDYIKLFSNFGKTPNVDYLIDFEEEEMTTKYKYSKEQTFGRKEKINLLKNYTHNQTNFRRITSLSIPETKPFLNCLKPERANDYNDWKRIGICLYNMDDRNYEMWRSWSSQSDKYNEDSCIKAWYSEFPKCCKYNLGLNKLKEIAKNDNIEEYNKIININKLNFFDKWIYAHAKETHIKTLSISTLSNFIKIYIKDYANFNIACACPGTSPIWYKFDNHKWTEDKAANKIYMLMTEELQKELTTIHEDLKNKVFREQNDEQQRIENNRISAIANANSNSVIRTTANINNGDRNNDDDEESLISYQRHLVDDRDTDGTVAEQKTRYLENQHTKACLSKCGAILEFLSTPINKKKIIEDLSQKCYDEEFYTNLDENRNVFVCNNGVLDLEHCIFRNGEPADMMTISSKINFPKDVDSLDAQEIIISIQEWLDKIFPEDEVQDYVLNLFASKLAGVLYKEWMHIFTGSGANGKSQWFKMLNKVFGEYFKTFDNTLLNTAKRDANAASPAIASLKGCRIAVTTEPKGGQPFESDKVKELISGDELVGRHLNKDLIRFIPQYAMCMQCNDIPRNESTDDGFWRKIFIIPCPSKFICKEEDLYKLNDPVKFPYHFRAENQEHLYTDWAPYFLYLLFERYKELKRCGFKFNVPDKVRIAVKEYQEEASTYTQFFNEKIIEAPGFKIDSNTLYSEFQLFVGRDFKTQKSLFLKQMERFLGKPKGRNKDYYNFKLFGSSGDPIDEEPHTEADLD
jgi:P4 family phage/plasmid primase-like protien